MSIISHEWNIIFLVDPKTLKNCLQQINMTTLGSVSPTHERKIIACVKFRGESRKDNIIGEHILRLFTDGTYSSHSIYRQGNVQTTDSTVHHGTWKVLEEKVNETKVYITPTRFEKHPRDKITPVEFMIEGSIKKPKSVIGFRDQPLNYVGRDSQEKLEERLPLLIVRDTVTPRPTTNIAAVVSGTWNLMKNASVKISPMWYHELGRRTFTGAMDSSFFSAKTNQERMMSIPNIKQIEIFGNSEILVLTEDGLVYGIDGIIKIPHEEPIHYILATYHEANGLFGTRLTTRFFITRRGNVYASGSNDAGRLGFGHTDNVEDLSLVPLPSGESAFKVVGSMSHTVILLHVKGQEHKSVVRSAGFNARFACGVGEQLAIRSFTEIPANYFDNSFIEDVACGDNFTYFLSASGALYACGDNMKGQCVRLFFYNYFVKYCTKGCSRS